MPANIQPTVVFAFFKFFPICKAQAFSNESAKRKSFYLLGGFIMLCAVGRGTSSFEWRHSFYRKAAWESLSSIELGWRKEGLDVGFFGEFVAGGKDDSFFAHSGGGAFLGHNFEELGKVVVGDFGVNLRGRGLRRVDHRGGGQVSFC